MPMGIKERGGRLQAFARGGNGHANHDLPPPRGPVEKRPDTPQVDAPAPTREELVETTLVPIPGISRHADAHVRDSDVPKHTAPQSPRKAAASPSPNKKLPHPEPRRPDPFEGSQLGESFMMSGRSTPQSEMEDVGADAVGMKGETGPGEPLDSLRDREFSDMREREREVRRQAFRLGEDGLMRVVNAGGRHNPSYMKDGFQGGIPNGHHRSSSSAEHQSKLPMREVKIQKPRTDMYGDYRGRDERRGSSPVPDIDRRRSKAKRWSTHPMDEEVKRPSTNDGLEHHFEYGNGDEELQATPKAKRTRVQENASEKSVPPAPVRRNSRDKKRRRASPDYDDMALSSMSYADLQREPFDVDPAKAAVQNGHGIGGDSLPEKLEQFRHQGDKEQRHMFAAMSMEDWEDSGDWFVDQFSDLMQRLKGARQSKRRTMQEFEYEAANREEAVRLRSEVVDRKLVRMKQDGQRVVETRER